MKNKTFECQRCHGRFLIENRLIIYDNYDIDNERGLCKQCYRESRALIEKVNKMSISVSDSFKDFFIFKHSKVS